MLKVIVLGDSGVGKTAFLSKYVSGEFIESHKATIGADFMTKDVVSGGNRTLLQIWDTAGQERFRALGVGFFRGADAVIFMYDITDKNSIDNIAAWKGDFLDHCNPPDAENFPMMLLGNKSDLNQQRQVYEQQGREVASNNNMLFFETSAKDGGNVVPAMEEFVRVILERSQDKLMPDLQNVDMNNVVELKEAGVDDETPPNTCIC